MKLFHLIPLLAAAGSAFVLPPEQVLGELTIEDHHGDSTTGAWYDRANAVKDDVLATLKEHTEQVTEKTKHSWSQISKCAKNTVDEALERAGNAADGLEQSIKEASDDAHSWIEESEFLDALEEGGDGHHGGRRPHDRPHKKPHHQPNQTVYQLIASSKYTTKLAKLISEYDDLVTFLNSTEANYTIFAPTDKAFEKIPEHAPKPSKEQLKAILTYHIVPGFYPAGRVLSTHTVPTLLLGEHLSSNLEPQRLTFKLGLRGLTINFYSRIVAINIFGTNGVIHGVDSIILPPPGAITIIDLFPGEFSTLELGLGKTGLLEKLNTTDHPGGTLFAPNNFAFQKLGPRINAFLFSKYGQKYLKALLEYHVVPGVTLYSDAIYKAEESDVEVMEELPRKGHFHIELPTFLKDRTLSVDIARFGGFISYKINGFSTVAVQDAVAEDGVIQVVRNVLIPPKKLGGSEYEHWDGSELDVEELKARLEPLVVKEYL